MKFKVEITETLQRIVEIEAASAEDAERQIRAAYRAGDIVLGAEDCMSGGDYDIIRDMKQIATAP